MNILAINSNTQNCKSKKQPSFKSITREVLTDTMRFYRNNTWFFRGDIEWGALIEYIERKHKASTKVNVYSLACSDGSEPYSLAMMLIAKLKENAQKFFPIIARDIDANMIEGAKSGKINLNIIDSEDTKIEAQTGMSIGRYMQKIKNDYHAKSNYYAPNEWQINEELRKTVTFEQGNVLEEAYKICPENSIVMIRNVWPYLSKEEAELLRRNLAQRMRKNSTLIIGNFDYDRTEPNIERKLIDVGFKKSPDIKNCFETTR